MITMNKEQAEKYSRDFWMKKVTKAISMMTDEELASMCQNFSNHPGARFLLEIRHKESTHECESGAYVVADATAEIHSFLSAKEA